MESGKRSMRYRKERQMRKRVMEILIRTGMKANILGFKYIQDAMELLFEDDEYLFKTTALYEALGKRNKTSYACAERNIRSAFNSVCYKKEFQEFFEQTDDYTNGNLLAILYWKLKGESLQC